MPTAAETRFDELKRYVSFSEDDSSCLALFGARAAADFPRIAAEFYERVREHADAHAVLSGEAQIARLQDSLVRWMGRLCSGAYDQAYFDETANIGRVHVKVGLPQRFMFTAMALVRVALMRLADERMGELATRTREAVSRLLDVELAIMVEAYHDDLAARLQSRIGLERDELRRALSRTERRYADAVEGACVLIVGLDASGTIRLFNREAERITAFAREDALGEDFAAFLLQEDMASPHGAVIHSALQGGATEPLRTSMRTRAGRYRDVRLHFGVAPATEADDIALFVFGIDVTEEAAAAGRLRRTENLAAIGTLAAGLAHEIRNPLNGALLHVAFLSRSLTREGGSHDELEAVRVVSEEISRLANLVTEFLDFARPRPPERKALSVCDLCRRVALLVAAEPGATTVVIEQDLPSRDIEILADAAKLEQVLLNLLRNAVEATEPQGGGRVILRARRLPRHVRIEVEDDGPGLENPNAPIFDAFFSTKPNGTGLGLAIAHRVVTDHNGEIGVESRRGRTVFHASLPL